jgi:hypothetical protein
MDKNLWSTGCSSPIAAMTLSVNKISQRPEMEIAKMGWVSQEEFLSKRLLPFVRIARGRGCNSLREMRPIVEAEKLKVFPNSGKLTQSALYVGLRAMKELGMDPGPDDASTARKRVIRRKQAARVKGS